MCKQISVYYRALYTATSCIGLYDTRTLCLKSIAWIHKPQLTGQEECWRKNGLSKLHICTTSSDIFVHWFDGSHGWWLVVFGPTNKHRGVTVRTNSTESHFFVWVKSIAQLTHSSFLDREHVDNTIYNNTNILRWMRYTDKSYFCELGDKSCHGIWLTALN